MTSNAEPSVPHVTRRAASVPHGTFKSIAQGVRATVRLSHLKKLPPRISGSAVPRDDLRPEESGRSRKFEPAHAQQTSPAQQSTSRMDPKTWLRKHIAADPAGFFHAVDTDQDGILSREEWAQACAAALGDVAPEVMNELFDEMDLNKDGRVSREEFIDMRNTILLFVKEAKLLDLVVAELAADVAAILRRRTSRPQDDVVPVAEQTLVALLELSEEELLSSLAAVSPCLKVHAERVRREREERAERMVQLCVDPSQSKSKFSELPTAAYGNKDSFHKGLEVIGTDWPSLCVNLCIHVSIFIEYLPLHVSLLYHAMCVCVCVCVCVYVCLRVWICTLYALTREQTHTHTCAHTHTTRTHAHTHKRITHTHIHTYTGDRSATC